MLLFRMPFSIDETLVSQQLELCIFRAQLRLRTFWFGGKENENNHESSLSVALPYNAGRNDYIV